ncbi:MAG: 4'-phosphopantetheinyl transferase superfamily protein [Paracoccaceae bacterium]
MAITPVVAALNDALTDLFPSGVAVAALAITDTHPPLHETEAMAIPGAVASRRAEFATGRAAARLALARLGHGPATIPAGPDRLPLWPTGLSGSIAHSSGYAVAAVRHGAPIGLDIEAEAGLESDLWPLICNKDELDRLPMASRGWFVTQIFSAKEAAYKAMYPLTRKVIGFDAMTVRLTGDDFVARLERTVGSFAGGHEFHGRLRRVHGLILTGVAP